MGRADRDIRTVTFRAFSEEYMRLRRAKKDTGLHHRIVASLKPLMKAFGEMPLHEMNDVHIQWYIERRLTARSGHGWRVRPRTVNAELATLSAIFREAEKRRLVELTNRMRLSLRPGPTFGPPRR